MSQAPLLPADHAALWPLDEQILFLNHGSFGACPRSILEYQQSLRDRLERQPVQMLLRDVPGMLDAVRAELGAFVSAAPEGLAFVQNATTGVNTVLRSLDFHPGDELLVTNHAYGACRNALDFTAQRAGAGVVEVPIPFPLEGPDAIVDAVLGAVTERTRLALLDHVTSPTGLVFPLERLVPALRERGVISLVDGAHAPGMIDLRVDALGADFYVGNCHKWLCAPKSAGFIAVLPEHRATLRPLVISHGASAPADARFRAEFDWTGTGDPTPALCVPECIRVLGSVLPGGWPALRERNHALALEARRILCGALGTEAPCPDAMLGSMAAVPIPRAPGDPFELLRILLSSYRIEVQIYPTPFGRLLRASAQLYNRREQYERLAEVLPAAFAEERRRAGCGDSGVA